MADTDIRAARRDSSFLLANVRRENDAELHRVRVRNLSNGGMMGEGGVHVSRSDRISIELRDIGQLTGTIAWVHGRRFGVAFDEDIDAERALRSYAMVSDKD